MYLCALTMLKSFFLHLIKSMNTSLYIHIPWCIQKCPYCDFNSHQKNALFNEMAYVDCLIADFEEDVTRFGKTKISSIFIGGGTPSLFSGEAYEKLFTGLKQIACLEANIEITLEANPGTLDLGRFKDYRDLGINRLSIGVQSFQDEQLKRLGRIHDANAAIATVAAAHQANFQNINIDLMYGLPEQGVNDALNDLNIAISLNSNHLSWYELTIEPNTVFYKHPPKRPDEEIMLAIEQKGRELLAQGGFERYEISAYGKQGARSEHNLNYWRFGDYYGIGAGAHGKMTNAKGSIIRTAKLRQPGSYLKAKQQFIADETTITDAQALCFEFMLNQARLLEPITFENFEEKTGLKSTYLINNLKQAQSLGLIQLNNADFKLTEKGVAFSNELVQLFLEET
jgi:putative oxygen-independent coproporphyrinogen III oxidase